MAPYDDAAEVYLASGLWPIPVMGKNPPVSGATGYTGTVTPEKIVEWLHPDPVRRARAGRGVRLDNLAIRHQATVAIDVDQGYGEKDGVAQLAAWAAKLDLPPLPATWSSTARGDDSPSRQYLYRIPSDIRMKTKPCKAVELCNWHHRFTVCAPSIHPNGNVYAWYLPGEAGVPPTWGERTDRYPRVDVFADLPREWFEAFRGAEANADRTAATVDLREFVAGLPAGEPDALVQLLIEQWSDPDTHVGHDEAKQAFIHAFMLGREGHPGVEQLITVLYTRLKAYTAVARPDDPDEAAKLVRDMAVIAQQKPLTQQGGVKLGAKVQHDPLDASVDATDDEMAAFIRTYTRYTQPAALGRRVAWAKADPASRQVAHARRMVSDAIDGLYPAMKVARAIRDVYRHHGGANPAIPRKILSQALGAYLNAKAAA